MLASLLLAIGLSVVKKPIGSAGNINQQCVKVGTQQGWWQSRTKELAQSCARAIKLVHQSNTQHFYIVGVRYPIVQCLHRRTKLCFRELYLSVNSPKPLRMLLLQRKCWGWTTYRLIRSALFRIWKKIGWTNRRKWEKFTSVWQWLLRLPHPRMTTEDASSIEILRIVSQLAYRLEQKTTVREGKWYN
jgi:hypothetical protein